MSPRFRKSGAAHARRAAALACLFSFAACSDNNNGGPSEPEPAPEARVPAHEVRTIGQPVMPRLNYSMPNLAPCGTPVEYVLTDLRHRPGKVIVSNDAQNLYVTYTITEKNWYISDTRLSVNRSLQTVPKDSRGVPNPWLFPYSGEHEPVITTYTYAVSLAQLGVSAGTRVVVAAMAGVVHPTTSRLDGPWEWLVAWGLGNISGNSVETVHNYTIAACSGPVPPPPPPTSGVFTITFDDGFATTHSVAYPILKEFGFEGNVAVNADPIDGQWESYLTLAQLRELHNNGWDVVSHTLSHRDLTTLMDAELHRELKDNQAWIVRNGFRGSNIFIVPFHSWGTRERTAIQQYYKYARGFSVNQFWPARMVKYPVPDGSRYDVTGYEPEFAPFTTAEGRAATMEIIERAIQEGEFVDIFFHTVTPAQAPAFREMVRMMAAHKASFRTYTEALR